MIKYIKYGVNLNNSMNMTEQIINDTKYKSYLDQRQSLIESEVEASNRFDKGILTFAGGALALSLTFINKIAPTPISWTLWLLGVGWLFLLLTLIVSLSSHLTSQAAMRRQREILGKDLENDEENVMSSATHWLNISSMVFFSLGVIFICIFTLYNLPIKTGEHYNGNKRNSTSKARKATTKTQKGKIKMAKEIKKTKKIDAGIVPPIERKSNF